MGPRRTLGPRRARRAVDLVDMGAPPWARCAPSCTSFTFSPHEHFVWASTRVPVPSPRPGGPERPATPPRQAPHAAAPRELRGRLAAPLHPRPDPACGWWHAPCECCLEHLSGASACAPLGPTQVGRVSCSRTAPGTGPQRAKQEMRSGPWGALTTPFREPRFPVSTFPPLRAEGCGPGPAVVAPPRLPRPAQTTSLSRPLAPPHPAFRPPRPRSFPALRVPLPALGHASSLPPPWPRPSPRPLAMPRLALQPLRPRPASGPAPPPASAQPGPALWPGSAPPLAAPPAVL